VLGPLAGALLCCAQPVPLAPGVIVTGQCYGHESEPGCVLPNLFGSQGLTLANSAAFPHYAHYIGTAQETLNQGVGTAIATQLATLPLISPSSGFTYKYDADSGVFVRSTTSFGPIYTERAETIGRGKLTFGISYQRFRFGSLDGIDLHNIPSIFTHVPNTGPGAVPEPYESDVVKANTHLNLNLDQTLLYGTVGITDRLDVSVAVPVVSVRFGATSDVAIIRVSGQTFSPSPGVTLPNPHMFANGTLNNTYASTGTAFGIGDVTLRIKQNIFQAGGLSIAAAMDVRAPSGDARKFLGSGAAGLKPFVAISGGKRVSPHLNLGYQWNGSSILAGNLTGAKISETSVAGAEVVNIENGPATTGQLPSQFIYSLGADYGATKRLTVNFDYLGQVLVRSPRVFASSFTTANIPGGTGAISLPTITAGKDTIGLNSGAAGFKYNVHERLLVTADFLFRMDNKGLRQNVTPLLAVSYAFGN
jgi:hypothetical protein